METQKSEWSEFEKEWTRRIVGSINRIREAAQLTVKDLAKRLRDLGWPISDATLSGMLSGGKRTSISVAEVTAFARALNVSPLYFILGLPETSELPESRLWGKTAPKTSLIAGWFADGRILSPFPGDDLTRKNTSSAAYIAGIYAEQGLDDLLAIARMGDQIRWQAAQLLAFERFDRADIEKFIPEEIWSQHFLWQAIGRLSGARRDQRELGDGWGLALSSLPEVLRFIDAEPVQQRDDFTPEELATLVPPPLVDRAEVNTRELIERRKNLDGPSERQQDGSPS